VDDGDNNANGGQDLFAEAEFDPGTYYVVVEDESDDDYSEETYTFCIDIFTGIASDESDPSFSIGPNPNRGNFIIRQNPEQQNYNLLEIRLFDPYGKELLKISKDHLQNREIPIRIEAPAAGLYLLKFITDEGVKTEKFIIQK
jgi:hypothetical protein